MAEIERAEEKVSNAETEALDVLLFLHPLGFTEGKRLGNFAQSKGMDPYDTAITLLRSSSGSVASCQTGLTPGSRTRASPQRFSMTACSAS